jgi:transcriptional regulator with XRE-family HTH domain
VASYLDINLLATMVRARRGRLPLHEIALEIGNISPSTLSRIENGKMPDMETFLLLCDWLQVPVTELIKSTESFSVNNSDAITMQLQADKNLDPAVANALAVLIKAAYKQDVAVFHAYESSNKDIRRHSTN